MEDLSFPQPDLPDHIRDTINHPFMATLRALPPSEAVGFIHWGVSECDSEQVKEDMGEVLYFLPSIDLEHARGVYRAYAESEDIEDRYDATTLVSELLTKHYDHELGLELWEKLLTDRAWEVRQKAWEQLTMYLGEHADDEEGLRRDVGMTGLQAAVLLMRYSQAEDDAKIAAREAARRAEAVTPVPEQRRHRWLGKIATWLNG